MAHVIRELFAERTRILLTILAIAWGTASITIMLAVGEGLRLTFGESMRGMGEGILIVWAGQTSRAYGGLPEGRGIPLKEDLVRLAQASIPEIGAISGEYSRWGSQMQNGDKRRSGRVSGVDPDYGPMRNIIPLEGGRFLDPMDDRLHRKVAVIGSEVVEQLFGKDEGTVGKFLDIDGRPFLIVGVMRKKFQSSSYSGSDRDGTWIPRTTFKTMYGSRNYSNLVVKPDRPEDMESVKTRLREIIARDQGCDPTDKEIVRYWDTRDTQKTSNNIFFGFQVLLGVIGGLTLIVAGVGVANVMFVSVTNATRDIGIRMAVGARDHQVIAQYVLEGLAVTAVGGLLGIGASKGVIALIGRIPMEAEFFKWVGRPVPILSSLVAAVVVLILGLIGFAAGIFPARRAARVDPAEALRYE